LNRRRARRQLAGLDRLEKECQRWADDTRLYKNFHLSYWTSKKSDQDISISWALVRLVQFDHYWVKKIAEDIHLEIPPNIMEKWKEEGTEAWIADVRRQLRRVLSAN
jgi:hypothetical protein